MRPKTSLWIVAVANCIGLGTQAFAAPAASPSDELQKWIAERAVPVRTIDAADEDFRDLAPLIDAIGTARVVQLGEPSHGAGSAFTAKTRLIKFLHQRMGFDVVAWESGLYAVHLTQAGMRSGDDGVTAAQKGILAVWSWTEELKPLFEYAKLSQSSGRPLDMAGFDMQVSSAATNERFPADLRAFVAVLRDPALRERASGLVETILPAHQNLTARGQAVRRIEAENLRAQWEGRSPQNGAEAMAAWGKTDAAKLIGRKEDIDALERASNDLLAMIRKDRAAFAQVHPARHISFMERVIDNMRAYDRNQYERARPDRPTGAAASVVENETWNRRDAQNAANLRWLVEEGYPGRKIIVWAHNVHTMNAYYSADVNSIHIEPQPGGLEPSGLALAKWLRNDVYTIAMTSYEGADGWDSSKAIAQASKDSLESRLHALGKPYVFLDFRALDGNPGHPMRKPQSLRIDRYRDDRLTDVTRAFDAVFFLDRMAPATRLGARPPAASP